MTMATKVLTAHVPLQLADKVDQMASRLERSRGWIVKQALSAWLAQEEERDRLTQEAMADVEAGLVIDHQAVLAWAESLLSNSRRGKCGESGWEIMKFAMNFRARPSMFCGYGTPARNAETPWTYPNKVESESCVRSPARVFWS